MKHISKKIVTLSYFLMVALVVSASFSFAHPPRAVTAAATPWTKTFGGSGTDYVYASASDSDGAVYVGGAFQGANVNFNPGGSDLKSSNSGSADAFLTKWNADGSYGWTKTWGGSGTFTSDLVRSLEVDDDGNVYAMGYFSNPSVNFNPDGSDVQSSSGYDIFLTKWNANGSYGWTKKIGGTSNEYAYDMAYHDNALFISGVFTSASVNFNPDGSDTRTNAGTGGTADAFITKWNTDGTYGWTKKWGGTASEATSGIGVGSDIVYTGGTFGGTNVNFNPDGSDLRSSNGATDLFVSRWSTNGSYVSSTTWGSTDTQTVSRFTIDSDQNAYITGQFFGTNVNFNPYGTDTFTATGFDPYLTKLNADGTYGWTRVWAAATGTTSTVSMTTDDMANVYVGGNFQSTTPLAFNPSGGDTYSTDAYTNAFITKWSSAGDYKWSHAWGVNGVGDNVYSLQRSQNTNVIRAGGFFGGTNVDFGPLGSGTYSSNGGADAFIARLVPVSAHITDLPAGLSTTFTGSAVTNDGVEKGYSADVLLQTAGSLPIARNTALFSDDLSWSNVTADVNESTATAFVHGLTAAAGADSTFTLYVPYRTGDIKVGICPGATSLAEVSTACAGLYYATTSDSNVSIETINSKQYWAVEGLTGTGGFSVAAAITGPTTPINSASSQSGSLAATGGDMLWPLAAGFGLLLVAAGIFVRNKLR